MDRGFRQRVDENAPHCLCNSSINLEIFPEKVLALEATQTALSLLSGEAGVALWLEGVSDQSAQLLLWKEPAPFSIEYTTSHLLRLSQLTASL